MVFNSSYDLSRYIPKICTGCTFYNNNKVWGYGNRKNKIIFVGEAPGAEEDRQCTPFVGRSGQLLSSMMKQSGLPRELFYITNILKCRPENNRTPSVGEIRRCSFFLKYELLNIKPLLIIPLGSTSTSFFLDYKGEYSSVVNKFLSSKLSLYKYLLYPLYHPAYVLRGGISKDEYLKMFFKLKQGILIIINNMYNRFKILKNILEK